MRVLRALVSLAWVRSFWIVCAFVRLSSAGADTMVAANSFGAISIEASRRELLARIQDWTDDRVEIQTRRVLACALAGPGFILNYTSMDALTSAALLHDLPKLAQTGEGGGSSPLDGRLGDLALGMRLLPQEREAFLRLRLREVQGPADRIRLLIDAQGLLMKVLARLYLAEIEFHVQRTQGFVGLFRADTEYCAVYTLQHERDTQLILAVRKVLSLYDFLEQALRD